MKIKKQTKNGLTLITALLIMSSLSGCGHEKPDSSANNTAYAVLTGQPILEEHTTVPSCPESQPKSAALTKPKFSFKAAFEGIVLKNDYLRRCVYEQLAKEDNAPLYPEELEAHRGLLYKRRSFTISNGWELDFVRTYFDLDSFDSFHIRFSPDLHDWTTAQLEGLKDLQKPVWISGTKNTVPAKVLAFFTGTDSITFENIADVTGTLPSGRPFSGTIREVTLLSYGTDRSGTYENLFACMQDSNVESLCLPRLRDNDSPCFLLDDIAGMRSLVSIDLNGRRIRVENKEFLPESSLQTITNFVLDKDTDTSLFQMLPQLDRIVCDVASDADSAFLLENDTLSARLLFCPELIEDSDSSELYPDGRPAILPALDASLGWREAGDDDNFLAIYQRFFDDGRKIECFSIRYLNENYDPAYDAYPILNDRTFLRVTDNSRVHLLFPERNDPDLADFGSYRGDYVSLADIDFDGINDILLDTGGFGNSLASYAFGWIYDSTDGTYHISDSFRSIENPFVDSECQLIRSAWRISASSHGLAAYQYDRDTGSYRMERQLIENDCTDLASELLPGLQIPENGTLWGYEETIYAEDGMTALETNHYYTLDAPGYPVEYPDASDNFHEPDSYWSYE